MAGIYQCPACGKVFLEELAMTSHHKHSHGESLVGRD